MPHPPPLDPALQQLLDRQAIQDVLVRYCRAVDRAGFAVIAAGLKQCLIESDGADTLDTKTMEKLFLSLA